jgi:uncharacterized protein (DUF305 family)
MPTTIQNRTAQRRRSLRLALLAASAAGLAVAAAPAQAAVEENYASGEPPITTTWFAPVSDAAQRADRDYIAGMRPHHAGALTMSREYLADPGRSSPLLQALARAIVANQTFEIGVLDEVARNLDRPPVRLPFGVRLQPVATEGLTGAQRFFKEPIPSELTYAAGPVSERDVRFAKAMIIHHQGAVEMARGYQNDRDARNGFLGLMNVDIVTDQTQEIALMRRVTAAYPGDADAVRVDPSMVHGMEGMKHGAHGRRHPPATAAPAGAGRPARAGAAEHQHGGHHAGHPHHAHRHHDGHAGHERRGHAHHGAAQSASAPETHAHPAPVRPRAARRPARPAQPSSAPAGQDHDHDHH